MNKSVKSILTIAGVLLLGYGIYQLIIPEASFDIGILKVEEQDNTNAFITIALGLFALGLRFFADKK